MSNNNDNETRRIYHHISRDRERRMQLMQQQISSSSNRPIATPRPRPSLPMLIGLCKDQNWEKVESRCRSNPEEAVPSAAYHSLFHSQSTALHICCERHAPLGTIKLLAETCPMQLRTGVSVWGTPLHEAISKWLDLQSILYLIEADARIEELQSKSSSDDGTKTESTHLPPPSVQIRDTDGRTPLHRWAESLLVLPIRRNTNSDNDDMEERILEVTRKIVLSYPPATALADKNGRTPLMTLLKWDGSSRRQRRIVEQRILNVTEIIVSAFPSSLSVTCSSFGCTPLHYAVIYRRNVDILRLLLRSAPQSAVVTNNIGELPLHIAAMMSASQSELQLLLDADSAAATVQDRGGRTPLHWAWIRFVCSWNAETPSAVTSAARRHVPADFLELQQACLDHIYTIYSSTPESTERSLLQFLSFWDTVRLLLLSPPLLLHAASSMPCPRAVLKIALFLHPEQIRLKNAAGNLPFHLAVSSIALYSSWRLDDTLETPIDLLLHIFPEAACITDSKFRLPLHLFLDTVHRYKKPPLDKIRTIMHAYPEALSRKDGVSGLCPFMLAARHGSLTICFELLKEGPEMVSFGIVEQEEDSPLADAVAIVPRLEKKQRVS